jgi:hypothetical protein
MSADGTSQTSGNVGLEFAKLNKADNIQLTLTKHEYAGRAVTERIMPTASSAFAGDDGGR